MLICLLLAGCGGRANKQAPLQAPPSQPPPSPGQQGSVSISPQYLALAPGQVQPFEATTVPAGGALEWLVNGIAGGNTAVGTIDGTGTYVAPPHPTDSMNVTVSAALASSPQANFATAVASIVQPGIVTATANPQVATYSIYLPAPGKVSINFGSDNNYRLSTWRQATPTSNGGQVSVYTAGMRAQTLYHMRAQVSFDNGANFTDSDHTFTSGTPPVTAAVVTSTTNGQIPQAGIELYDTLVPNEEAEAFATDLQGNVIWTYAYPDGTKDDTVQPIEILPNGHFLVLISYASSIAVHGVKVLPGTVDAVREVDLAGNTIREVTQSSLASALATKGFNLRLGGLHHDVISLPNGHWVMLASVTQSFDNLTGFPGTTDVLGDLVIDVDPSGEPVWTWNTFDHLDVNRHPLSFPDWTHSNALVYSTDDHELLLSIRNQNWIIKIDYADGQGSGRILWRLGEGGDFKLIGGADPQDWFYAQHGPSFFGIATSGVFNIGVMDNGNDRLYPGALVCGTASGPACASSAPVYQVNETAMTATLTLRYPDPQNEFNPFGGSNELLPNGDMHVDFCANPGGSLIEEVATNSSKPTLIWQAQTKGTNQYRAKRLPSLYPGVQW